MQQRFSKEETKSPESYCLHLFSAQEAERVPTWTWAPRPLGPTHLALQPPAHRQAALREQGCGWGVGDGAARP